MKKVKIFLLTALFMSAVTGVFSQSAEEWKKMGNAAFDSADYRHAVEYYHNAIEVDSMYFDAYYNLGSLYYNISEFDGAIIYFSKALEIDDTDTWTWIYLANSHIMIDDYDSAIKLLEKRIAAKPDSPQVLFWLGYAYQKIGDDVNATWYVKRAAQLGDSLAQQFFIENGISWEDNFVKPDYEQIKLNIENKESNFYYPVLFERYLQGDSTMTLDECRHLYYGYTFHENHSPYAPVINSEQIKEIIRSDEITKETAEKLITLLDAAIEQNPFNLTYISYQNTAYLILEKEDDYTERNMSKIRYIMQAMYSTGDGLTKETAIHVISVSNEYDYLYLQRMSSKAQELVDGRYDVMSLNENEWGTEEMWFDISKAFNFMWNDLKELQKKSKKERRRR